MCGVELSTVQGFVLSIELYEVSVHPLLQLVEVHLKGGTTCWCISHSTRSYIISKLTDFTFCPIIQVVSEDVEQC